MLSVAQFGRIARFSDSAAGSHGRSRDALCVSPFGYEDNLFCGEMERVFATGDRRAAIGPAHLLDLEITVKTVYSAAGLRVPESYPPDVLQLVKFQPRLLQVQRALPPVGSVYIMPRNARSCA